MSTLKKAATLRPNKGDGNTAYIELRDHPRALTPGVAAKSVFVHWLIEDYRGPSINIDFDGENRAIGIEIIYPAQDELSGE